MFSYVQAHLSSSRITPHATATDGHNNLLLTMAMDLSSDRGKELELPLDLDDYYR